MKLENFLDGIDVLTSLKSSRVKEVVKLRKRRERDKSRMMLIEGRRELEEALRNGAKLKTLYVCESLFDGRGQMDIVSGAQQQGVEIVTVSEPVACKMAYRDNPEGLLAVAPQPVKRLENITLGKTPFVAILEGIEKPGNLGAVLRAADGAGVDGLLLCDCATDIYNPNTIRASLGTFFTMPFAEVSSSEALQWCRQNGLQIVAATPDADLVYTKADLSGPCAVVVGSEDRGLGRLWLDEADVKVRIPMKGRADSLNAAVSTAILLYESMRQREA